MYTTSRYFNFVTVLPEGWRRLRRAACPLSRHHQSGPGLCHLSGFHCPSSEAPKSTGSGLFTVSPLLLPPPLSLQSTRNPARVFGIVKNVMINVKMVLLCSWFARPRAEIVRKGRLMVTSPPRRTHWCVQVPQKIRPSVFALNNNLSNWLQLHDILDF